MESTPKNEGSEALEAVKTIAKIPLYVAYGAACVASGLARLFTFGIGGAVIDAALYPVAKVTSKMKEGPVSGFMAQGLRDLGYGIFSPFASSSSIFEKKEKKGSSGSVLPFTEGNAGFWTKYKLSDSFKSVLEKGNPKVINKLFFNVANSISGSASGDRNYVLFSKCSKAFKNNIMAIMCLEEDDTISAADKVEYKKTLFRCLLQNYPSENHYPPEDHYPHENRGLQFFLLNFCGSVNNADIIGRNGYRMLGGTLKEATQYILQGFRETGLSEGEKFASKLENSLKGFLKEETNPQEEVAKGSADQVVAISMSREEVEIERKATTPPAVAAVTSQVVSEEGQNGLIPVVSDAPTRIAGVRLPSIRRAVGNVLNRYAPLIKRDEMPAGDMADLKWGSNLSSIASNAALVTVATRPESEIGSTGIAKSDEVRSGALTYVEENKDVEEDKDKKRRRDGLVGASRVDVKPVTDAKPKTDRVNSSVDAIDPVSVLFFDKDDLEEQQPPESRKRITHPNPAAVIDNAWNQDNEDRVASLFATSEVPQSGRGSIPLAPSIPSTAPQRLAANAGGKAPVEESLIGAGGSNRRL